MKLVKSFAGDLLIFVFAFLSMIMRADSDSTSDSKCLKCICEEIENNTECETCLQNDAYTSSAARINDWKASAGHSYLIVSSNSQLEFSYIHFDEALKTAPLDVKKCLGIARGDGWGGQKIDLPPAEVLRRVGFMGFKLAVAAGVQDKISWTCMRDM